MEPNFFKTTDIKKDYKFGELLGEGSFA